MEIEYIGLSKIRVSVLGLDMVFDHDGDEVDVFYILYMGEDVTCDSHWRVWALRYYAQEIKELRLRQMAKFKAEE